MQETFYEYRACELKHGRVAMMVSWLFPGASVGGWGSLFLSFQLFGDKHWNLSGERYF